VLSPKARKVRQEEEEEFVITGSAQIADQRIDFAIPSGMSNMPCERSAIRLAKSSIACTRQVVSQYAPPTVTFPALIISPAPFMI
jgi:hypothetical protein